VPTAANAATAASTRRRRGVARSAPQDLSLAPGAVAGGNALAGDGDPAPAPAPAAAAAAAFAAAGSSDGAGCSPARPCPQGLACAQGRCGVAQCGAPGECAAFCPLASSVCVLPGGGVVGAAGGADKQASSSPALALTAVVADPSPQALAAAVCLPRASTCALPEPGLLGGAPYPCAAGHACVGGKCCPDASRCGGRGGAEASCCAFGQRCRGGACATVPARDTAKQLGGLPLCTGAASNRCPAGAPAGGMCLGGVCCPKARACFSRCCGDAELCVLGQCVIPSKAPSVSAGAAAGSRVAVVCEVSAGASIAAGAAAGGSNSGSGSGNAMAAATTTTIYCPRDTLCLGGACVPKSLACDGRCCAPGSTCINGGQAGAKTDPSASGGGRPRCCALERVVAVAATGTLRCCAAGAVAGAEGTGRCFASAGGGAAAAAKPQQRAAAVRAAAAACPLSGHLRPGTNILGGDVPRPQLPRGTRANGATADSVAECCARCASGAPACAHFTYEVATRRCFLKAAGGSGTGGGTGGAAPVALDSSAHVSGTMLGAKPVQSCPASRACPQIGLCCSPSKECRAAGAGGVGSGAAAPAGTAARYGDLVADEVSAGGGGVRALFQAPAAACVTACRASVYEQGVSYSGGDLAEAAGGVAVGSVRECCQRCSEADACGAFTFDADRGRCYLKGGGSGQDGDDGDDEDAAAAGGGGGAAAPAPTGARGAVKGGQFFSGRLEGVAPVPDCPADELCGTSCGCDDGLTCQGGKTCSGGSAAAGGGGGGGGGGAAALAGGAGGAGGAAGDAFTTTASFPFLAMPGLPPAPAVAPSGALYAPLPPAPMLPQPMLVAPVAPFAPAATAPAPAALPAPAAPSSLFCGTSGAACTAGQLCVGGACCPSIYACADGCCRPPKVCSGNACADPNAPPAAGAGGPGGAAACPSGLLCSGACCPSGSRCVSGGSMGSRISGSVSAGVCCPTSSVCAGFGISNVATVVTGVIGTPDSDSTCCRQGSFCTSSGLCCASGISCGLLCCALGETCAASLVSGDDTFAFNPSGFAGGVGGICCLPGRSCGDRCCSGGDSVCVISASSSVSSAQCCSRDRTCPPQGGRGALCCNNGQTCSTSTGTPVCT